MVCFGYVQGCNELKYSNKQYQCTSPLNFVSCTVPQHGAMWRVC